ncbi:hypothetical protein FRC07_004028 [Ceratobasidium sp. 392]|nr:hypothetical protein FRC07_004028 [Ceratobasidium sp. 392]
MDHENPLLAEFYYYTIGDKTAYNQELNDLCVCYTLARGLQLHCDRPRRPALPLEVILRIIRHAGFMDPKPDLELTSEAVSFAMNLRESGEPRVWYMAGPLNRVQLASMARMQLVNLVANPVAKVIPYSTTLWAFTPLGNDEKCGTEDKNQSIVASLYACSNEEEAQSVQKITPNTIIGDTFGLDHEISKQLDEGRCPLGFEPPSRVEG